MNMTKYMVPGMLLMLSASCIKLEDTVVDERSFLGEKTNSTAIYAQKGNGTFLNPFNINTNNWGLGKIDRLLLVEFEALHGYRAVELQIISKQDEQGALVIMYHADKDQADVYHTPHLTLSAEMYSNVLNNATITAVPLAYGFQEESGLLKAHLDFTDRFGNTVMMRIDEKIGEMDPCGLLAPIGGEAHDPEFMTIVFMKHFKFLSQREDEIQVEINGVAADLLKLPVRANGIKGYQTKYSMEPVTVSWNINANEPLRGLPVDAHSLYRGKDFEIECLNNGGHWEIRRFTGIQGANSVHFRFSPPIPDMQSLAENAKVSGRFAMSVDTITGIMAGEYAVEKQDGKIAIVIAPTKGYSPVPGRAWMKKMSWHAQITTANNDYAITSNWVKK
jgi:hypothetical protein